MAAGTMRPGGGRDQERPRRRNPLRTLIGALLILALLLVLLLTGTALIVQSRLDEAGLQARIEAEVLRQTGRQLTLGGLHVQLLPVPTVSAEQVSFANWPDGARPLMLVARSVQAHLALLPLLEHVVRLEGVTLDQPDILLERAADGTANWQFRKVAQSGGSGTGGGGARWRLQVGSVRLRDGSLAWKDARHGWSGAVQQLRVDGSGLAGGSPEMMLAGRHGTAGFTAEIQAGALSRLSPDDTSRDAWPLHVDATAQEDGQQPARLQVGGTVADPARMRGYALDVAAHAARLDALNGLFPNAHLPAVADLSLRTHMIDAAPADASRGDPQLESLSLHVGAFEAQPVLHSAWANGISMTSLSLDAKARETPLAVMADGAWRGQTLALRGTAGTLADWQQRAAPGTKRGSTLGPAWNSVPVALDLAVGAAHAHVDGSAGSAVTDLRLKVTAPALQPLISAGPALTDLALSGRVQTQQTTTLILSDLRLESRQLGLTGTATLHESAHPSLTAAISATHVDLDALRSGWLARPARPARPAPGQPPSSGPAHAIPEPAPAQVQPGGHVIPFAALRLADLAVRVDAQAVRLGGETYSDVVAQLAVQDGRLSLSPFSARGPAGPIAGTLAADASTSHVSLSLHPSMIRAETLADLFGQKPVVTGIVELVAELQGSGATQEALTANMAGRAGASMVDGSIANAALAQLVGRSAGQQADGRTALRCLALPAHVGNGIASIAPLALETRRLAVQGHGTIGLQDGRLDLHLLPRLSIGSAGASLPVHVGGSLGTPQAALDPAAPGGRFALIIGPGGPPPDICGPALQAARFGATGPQPGAPAEPDRPHKLPKPMDILRGLGLFR